MAFECSEEFRARVVKRYGLFARVNEIDWNALIKDACTWYPHWAIALSRTRDLPLPTNKEALIAANAAHNLALLEDVRLFLQQMPSQAVMGLKGLFMTLYVYSSVGFRPLGDVDFLVRNHDIPTATLMLNRQGYREVGVRLHSTATLSFQKGERSGLKQIELHVRPGHGHGPYYTRIAPEDLWNRAKRRPPVQGISMFFPSLEDQLLLWCLQIHDRFSVQASDLRWLLSLSDLILFLEKFGDELDLVRFREIAERSRLILPCKFSIDLCFALHSLPVAENLVNALAHRPVASREQKIFASFTWGQPADRLALRYIERVCRQGSFCDAIRYGFRALIPSSAFMKQRYRRPLLLAYIMRWSHVVCLLWRGLVLIWRSFPPEDSARRDA